MTNPQEVLDHLESDVARKARFNIEYTQLVMESVFAERRHQVKLGREGKIPWACEGEHTDEGLRLGVLGEEFGEVAKAIIEGQQPMEVYSELVQVAAVAVACAEGIARKVGLDPKQLSYDSAEKSEPMPDEHMQVLLRAYEVYKERNAEYRDTWKRYGLRGCMVHLRTCVERAWETVWLSHTRRLPSIDNLIDTINYAVFALRHIETEDNEGTWQYE